MSPRLPGALLGAFALLASLLLAGCQTPAHPPLRIEPSVDLDRFMGDWYVIANIPTFIERGAHNAVERYELDPDGTIATTFTFRDGGFDGELRTYRPRGFVHDRTSNAIWGMQFIWPIKADFRIVYVSPTYDVTVVGREKRDYAWLMARTPNLPDPTYRSLLEMLAQEGYDITKVQRVPQRWPEADARPRR
jgi:apolipoprotein D and lipocalin family protein